MKLPIPFIGGKKDVSEYFLALLLADEKVSAIILQEDEGKIKILGQQEEFFANSIEHASLEPLIEAVDKAISKAESVLPADVETHKTVFGVKQGWVEAETKKIKKEYLGKLKKVCDALDLSPIGFMVVSEAISNLLAKEEGAPLSAVLAEIGKKAVTLTLFRGGNIVEKVEGEIGNSIPAAVDRLLKHFTVEVLPARIILYDSDTTDTLAQHFIAHQWSKGLPFLHMPQISVLPQGFDGRAVTFGAGEQLGFEVLGDLYGGAGIKTYDHDSAHPLSVPHPAAEESVPSVVHHPEGQQTESHDVAELSSVGSPEAFGFVVGEDIAEKGPILSQAMHSTVKTDVHENHQAVPVDEPIRQHHQHVSDNLRIPEETVSEGEAFDEFAEEESDENLSKRRRSSGMGGFSLGKVLAGLPKMPSFRFPRLSGGGGMKKLIFLLAPVVVLLLLVGGVYFFYVYKVSATVHLSVKPNMVTQDQDVVFSSSGSSDFSKHLIAAKAVSGTADGDLSANTTGSKEVGDKAKGTVTIYNNSTDSDMKVSAGTTITSSNGLKFTLDKDISVASASGDIFSGTKPGKADVGVTASDIGTDYNLPSDTKFAVGGTSTLAGKNGSAFSGGTKKTVTVVSKDDLIKLKADLMKSLQGKASDALGKEASNGQTVLPVALAVSVDDAKFDKNLGDQAKSVTITGSVTFSGLAYNNDDMLNLAKAVLKDHYASDVTFADNSIQTDLKDPQKKDAKTITATIHVSAGLLPKITGDDVARQLSGKSLQSAEDTLSHLPQIDTHEIVYSPNVFFLPKLLMRLPNQVSVEIQSHE